METDHGFFWHSENISFGQGRILYAKAGMGSDGVWKAEGWVLPGGKRTTNRRRAYAAAVEIDRLTTENAAVRQGPIVVEQQA